jgi:hypothetical protein
VLSTQIAMLLTAAALPVSNRAGNSGDGWGAGGIEIDPESWDTGAGRRGHGAGAGVAWPVGGLLPRTDVTVTTTEHHPEPAGLVARGAGDGSVTLSCYMPGESRTFLLQRNTVRAAGGVAGLCAGRS